MAETEKPIFDEIATTRDGRDITRGYVDGLPLLSPQDPILRARGGSYGLGYEVYRELLRDDQVAATFRQRRLAVVSAEWEVIPGGKMRRDKMAADFMRETLQRIDIDRATDRMLYGVFYGYAIGELMLARDGQQVALEAIKVRSPRRFAFAPDSTPRLLTTAKPDGEPLPPNKFWHFTTGGDSDDEPYGLGLAHDLYWPVWFKRNGMRFWSIYLDKYGSPTAVGEYPAGANAEQKRALLDALEAIQSDAGVIIPQGMIIKFLETTFTGTSDFQNFVNSRDAAIAKIVLGQTMTTEASGGQYKGDIQKDVRDELVKADADLVCKSWNLGPATWLTRWNFPDAAVPQLWRKTEQPEDLTARASRDKTIADMGYKPTLKHITDTYGGEWVETTTVLATDPNAPPNPEFAERTPGQDAIDDIVDDELADWREQMGEIIDPAQQLADDATTGAAFLEGLATLVRTVTPKRLHAGLTRGAFKARATGDATDQIEEQ